MQVLKLSRSTPKLQRGVGIRIKPNCFFYRKDRSKDTQKLLEWLRDLTKHCTNKRKETKYLNTNVKMSNRKQWKHSKKEEK